MGDIAIRVEGVGKRYRIGEARRPAYGTLRDALTSFTGRQLDRLRHPLRPRRRDPATIWALKDVSFEVPRGEVIGIIGRNGAGKSTLLKILARITEPTEGRVVLHGRVGSLLEVGTGFHLELTGRENIYLNGAILGMKKAEIDRKFDEIVAFAEVERFIDTPVKHYSSGMHVRLAFAVAAHLEPEILLVDEVLAVGDAAFQKKCLGKMGEVATAGRTILFVSHNMLAVEALCRRSVWLDEGQLRGIGPTSTVKGEYLDRHEPAQRVRTWSDSDRVNAASFVKLRRIAVMPEGGTPADLLRTDRPLRVEVDYWNTKPNASLTVTMVFQDTHGVVAFTTNTIHSEKQWSGHPFPVGQYRSTCVVPASFLNAIEYRLRVLLVEDQTRPVLTAEDAVSFAVGETPGQRGAFFGTRPGLVAPHLDWTTERLTSGGAA